MSVQVSNLPNSPKQSFYDHPAANKLTGKTHMLGRIDADSGESALLCNNCPGKRATLCQNPAVGASGDRYYCH